jgi:hypothetical protein
MQTTAEVRTRIRMGACQASRTAAANQKPKAHY